MLKYILFASLAGSACAAGDIDISTQLYVVAGVLGGVCLILSIASIVHSVLIVSLQGKVTVLRRSLTASSAMAGVDAEVGPPPRLRDDNPIKRDMRYAYEGKDEYRRNDGPADHYRRPQDGYRMERFTGDPYHNDRHYSGGPVPPPRPTHRQDTRTNGYY
ncbi:uncharacterized protein [Panulirus ornatus]|uniref:uncharacterized protein isoform X1 n=1 Tax=Panulirus ornatus TaxID=150431 RepID=UPI003A8ACC54